MVLHCGQMLKNIIRLFVAPLCSVVMASSPSKPSDIFLQHPVLRKGHQDPINSVVTYGLPEGSQLVDLAPVAVMVHADLNAAVAGSHGLTHAHQ